MTLLATGTTRWVLLLALFSYGENRSINVPPDTLSTTYNSEPALISGGSIEYPSVLLKSKIKGIITAQLDISEKGSVEKCILKESLTPAIDSIIYNAIMQSRFSPAYDMGTPVPSTIIVQIPFSPDSLLIQNSSATPELFGTVYDKDSKRPIPGIIVNLQYKDTTSDKKLIGRFNEYLALIGQLPTQTANQGILSTRTDTSGHFSFRLLPDGFATIAVLAQGYTIRHFSEETKTGYHKEVNYYIEPYSEHIDSAYTITVYGIDSLHREVVNLEQEQYSSGLTHYLSTIILQKATIRQVPEAASALLVRSGSPYDNCYVISGVPMLAPFHFGGYPYMDIDGVMVSTLENVTVTVNRIGGVFPEVSGALIDVSPGIYRPAPKKLKKRSELTVDFSSIGQDFLLSIPLRKRDFMQIGFTRSEDFSLKWLKVFYGIKQDANINIGEPKSYGNLTLTGTMNFDNIRTEYFSWLAYDYSTTPTGDTIIPWGMASVKLYPTQQNKISIIAGGGHQFFAEGIRVQYNSFLKQTNLTNGIISLNIDSISSDFFTIQLVNTLSYQTWHGALEQRDNRGSDTVVNAAGKEFTLATRSTVSKPIGPFELSSNILLTGTSYGHKPDFSIDAGVALQWNNDVIDAEFNIGRVTGRPDIRGLPDSSFRTSQFYTYIMSLPLSMKLKKHVSLGLQPYARYQNSTPKIDPLFNTWNPALSSPVKAAGVDCDLNYKPFSWLELNGAANITQAYRDSEGDSTYEWNIPRSVRGRVHLMFYHDLFHMYLDGKYSDGLPYYDFNEQHYLALPNYKRLDFSLQYRSIIYKHRFLSRYDVYFVVNNLLNNFNVRSYYWNENMINHPIVLCGPTYIEIGARFGFRL